MQPAAAAAWASKRPSPWHTLGAACHAPWVSLEFDPQGWVYTCCANQQYPLGRIGRDRLSDLWSGARQGVLRDALRRWDLSVGCGSCRWHLEHGRLDPDAAVYDRYRLESAEPAGPAVVTFALSNRCNLGCVMCNGELSSTLRQQSGLPPLRSPYDDRFFEDLEPMLVGLQYAKFLGGEPFLVAEHERVWDLMERVGGPERIQVTTNGTVWTERVDRLLERFAVDVTVSIDAVDPARYAEVRQGASFDVVERNLERFARRCADAGTELRLCCCLMSVTWDQLAGLVRLAHRVDAALSVNVVSDPGLALHDLPTVELRGVAARWAAEDAVLRGTVRDDLYDCWSAQRVQLDAVLESRGRGEGPAPRQASRAPVDLLSPPKGSSEPARASAGEHRRRLEHWCGHGAIGELHTDQAGTIRSVERAHDRLGVSSQLIGCHLDGLLERLEAADGRCGWLAGDEPLDGARVVTVVLASQRPERGGRGSVVRVVFVAVSSGWVVLVAEDRLYDRPWAEAQPVVLGRAHS